MPYAAPAAPDLDRDHPVVAVRPAEARRRKRRTDGSDIDAVPP